MIFRQYNFFKFFMMKFVKSLVVVLLVCVACSLLAQEKEEKKVVYVIKKEFVIRGEVRNPVFFVTSKKALDLGGLKLEKSFLPKVIKSVEKKPF